MEKDGYVSKIQLFWGTHFAICIRKKRLTLHQKNEARTARQMFVPHLFFDCFPRDSTFFSVETCGKQLKNLRQNSPIDLILKKNHVFFQKREKSGEIQIHERPPPTVCWCQVCIQRTKGGKGDTCAAVNYEIGTGLDSAIIACCSSDFLRIRCRGPPFHQKFLNFWWNGGLFQWRTEKNIS